MAIVVDKKVIEFLEMCGLCDHIHEGFQVINGYRLMNVGNGFFCKKNIDKAKSLL